MARRTARSVHESVVRMSGTPYFLGNIAYAGSSVNSNTVFAGSLAGLVVLMQPSTDCYVEAVIGSAGTTSSTTGFLVSANERVTIIFPDKDSSGNQLTEERCFLAVIQSTASGTLKCAELR